MPEFGRVVLGRFAVVQGLVDEFGRVVVDGRVMVAFGRVEVAGREVVADGRVDELPGRETELEGRVVL